MSAAEAREPSGAATGSSITARLVLALWLSVCTLSLLLIALTIAFHLSTRYDWYFGNSFNPWRMLTVEAFGVIGVPILGALIVWRQPGNRYGWVWCALGLGVAVRGAAFAYEIWAWYVAPYQPGGWQAAWLGHVMDRLTLGLVPLLLVLFPGGRPPSPRWRPLVWATVVVCVVGTLLAAVAPGPMVEGTPNPIRWLSGTPADDISRMLAIQLWQPSLLLLALGALSLLARFWRARHRERQQIKWLAYVAVPLLASYLVQPIRAPRIGAPINWEPTGLVGAVYIAGGLWAIYIAIGIAVLRYHLYDIDRLINRTLVYGLLTALLGGVYAGVVLILGQLFGGIGTEPPSWAVAGATLAAAALFQPARRRIQQAVDRRFNRRRYDAAKTVEAFSARLRDHIDLDTLLAELLAVVDQTMQPTRASVWLRPAANQVGPMTALARAAPALTGSEDSSAAAGSGPRATTTKGDDGKGEAGRVGRLLGGKTSGELDTADFG
jgi:hypothetical protein